jgi:hypothetical protein
MSNNPLYGDLESKTGMKVLFDRIRRDVANAHSREALTEIYERVGGLVRLIDAPSWKLKHSRNAADLCALSKDEFRTIAKKIKRRAHQIGTEPDFAETWRRRP